MKHSIMIIIYIISLFALIIISGIITSLYLDRSAKELYLYLEKVEEYANTNKWELAKEELSVMEEKWNKVKKVWATLTDHGEIDSITISLARARIYIEEKDLPLALAEISVLKDLITHVPDKELPTLDNIF
ncbi:MAG TPA: DUF4363 family protein [Clostridiaceae bacterium]|nr:DUF4363 family protein [Clostridiaceae bacterium]